ncbi:putative defense protein 1 [Galendromus occidentalis]|uniref:Defense protein 1 n=1 Tax=Galendromus occidentalis TaxID=34638 RepID=A0AAJ7L7L0_9ACAR|nr:putative defense protein 1 [Galendromus occidentalis]
MFNLLVLPLALVAEDFSYHDGVQHFVAKFVFKAQAGGGLPPGGSVESCDSLLPRHIHTEPQGPRESPYTFIASSSTYSKENSVHGIQVEIAGSTFKGFIVAAIDPDTHKRIGRFQEVTGTQPLPCSAITHSDGQLKKRVSLLWVPPNDIPKGNVIFMATVVKSYSNYYAGLIAAVPMYKAIA